MDYLLLGPEEGEKNEWLADEKKRVLAQHPDAEVHQFYAGDDTGEAISSVLSQSSLFSSFRLVIIKQFENRSGKDGIAKAIEDYLKAKQDDAELIIVSSERSQMKIPKPILDGIGKDGVKMFWEMFENKKREWIAAAFRKEGFSITQDAVEEILFSTENNTQEMKNLVSSLSLYFRASDTGKQQVTVEDIEQYAIKTRGEDGYTLFSALAERDTEHALLIMKTLLESDSYGAIRAIGVVTSRFRLLESALSMKRKGSGMDYIAVNAEYLSPYPSSFSEKGIRKKDIPIISKAMQSYSLEDTQRIILYLGKMDNEIKAASSELLPIVLSSVIYTISAEKGRESSIDLSLPDLGKML